MPCQIGKGYRRLYSLLGVQIMNLNYQESSIVLVGGWNPSMLNPRWFEEFIVNPMNNEGYEIRKADFTFSLNNNAFSFRHAPISVSFGEFKIVFSGTRLMFQLEKGKGFSTLEKCVLNLCDCLSFTPVSEVRINFVFRSEENEDLDIVSEVVGLNKSNLHTTLEKYSFVAKVQNIDTTITLNINTTENKFEFRVNFNFNVQNSNEIKQTISENSMNNLKETIENFLTTTYNAKIME